MPGKQVSDELDKSGRTLVMMHLVNCSSATRPCNAAFRRHFIHEEALQLVRAYSIALVATGRPFSPVCSRNLA
jgi:hypothetical protein